METTGGKMFKLESNPVKKEPGVFIKREDQPSLFSLPMAPTMAAAMKPVEDTKLILGNIPKHGGRPGGRSRRRRGGNFITHRVDGYHIRAHYGNGKVDFTVNKDNTTSHDLNWKLVETEIFRKLHRAHFYIEPTQRPVSCVRQISQSQPATFRFSVEVRQILARLSLRPSSGNNNQGGIWTGGFKKEKDDEDSKLFLDLGSSSAVKASRSGQHFPQASLPSYLPDILSWKIDDKNGDQITYNS